MAKVATDTSCGCGYRTRSLEEASKHSDRSGHKMSILGSVAPDDEILGAKPVTSSFDPSRIDEIRKKLNGG